MNRKRKVEVENARLNRAGFLFVHGVEEVDRAFPHTEDVVHTKTSQRQLWGMKFGIKRKESKRRRYTYNIRTMYTRTERHTIPYVRPA